MKRLDPTRSRWLLLSLLIGSVTLNGPAMAEGMTESDQRIEVVMTESGRNLVLKEMRDFLQGLQALTLALANKDMGMVAKAAKPMGMAMMDGVPKQIRMGFPAEFRSLAMATHRDFDAIALDAEQLEDPQHTLAQLSNALAKCVGCHAGYRFSE